MKFSALDLDKNILRGIEDAGYVKCTPIQEQSLPESLMGKDVIGQSQTGTGKTAVFVITILARLTASSKASPKGPRGPRALIMAPTRELAVQLESEASKLGKHLEFRSVAIYGGVEYDKQVRALKEGVDIVFATPGRLIDLYKSKSLSVKDIEIFIIDEADRMFDIGFAPDIRYIASKLPKNKPRQTMLFSATIDTNIHRLATRYMKPDHVLVEVDPDQVTVDKIEQKILYMSNEEKIPYLMTLLKRPELERAIVFTNMKRTAETVEWKLKGNGFPAEVLTGDVSQSKRQRVIRDMKSGKVKILVATDVVARGLHIEDISHVINYDLPQDVASYVHRIGRTARAGKSGKAYSLVCEEHAMNLPEIEKFIEHKIEVEWLEEDEIVKDKAGPYRKRRPQRGPGAGGKKGGPRSAKGGKGGYGSKPGGGGRRPVKAQSRDKSGVKSGVKSGTKPEGKPGAKTEDAARRKAKEGATEDKGRGRREGRGPKKGAGPKRGRPRRTGASPGAKRGEKSGKEAGVRKKEERGKEAQKGAAKRGKSTESGRRRHGRRGGGRPGDKKKAMEKRADEARVGLKSSGVRRPVTTKAGAEKKSSTDKKSPGVIKRILKAFGKKKG